MMKTFNHGKDCKKIPHLLFFLQSLPWLKVFIILVYFLGTNWPAIFVMLLLIPASVTSPPTSQAILSMHSSDSMRAMYISCSLSTMFPAAESSWIPSDDLLRRTLV